MEIDEENPELRQLNATVLEDPDSFEAWEKLVQAAEKLDGGINRNSAPQSIASVRNVYDRFLAKFPLFFGYWKKYADLEFAIAGTEAAELVRSADIEFTRCTGTNTYQVYERGVASITISVDLWAQYCSFKLDTCHDYDTIRELFERASNSVGLDFLAHPFYDKYLEFEERAEDKNRVFSILSRIIHIPMHQYARYFESFRNQTATRPVQDLAPSETVAQFRAEIEMESGGMKSEQEIEQELRSRLDGYHLEIFQRTQAETTKRWTYEQQIKRPYFHVTELDDAQLDNWRKYLEFEEGEGDFQRTTFLYERCLVAAAYYDEFWLRYARWMLGQTSKKEDALQTSKTEEIRNIYTRAGCIYAPVARPAIRLQWALFEERSGRIDVAQAIYEAILMAMPGHVETIIACANSARRHSGLEEAVNFYRSQVQSEGNNMDTRAAVLAEWARLLWKIKGSSQEARDLYKQSQAHFVSSRDFWKNFLSFELDQPGGVGIEDSQTQNIKAVFDDVRRENRLEAEAMKEIAGDYMAYLLERGGPEAAKEYLALDREINT
ncbi:MAG: hypothetical protein M1828_000128 [Chrysothrix sp. TS-e1954]|nr:MAG: hypothetical protein M1828_000128 [Chrysothrix sp. TS-e1954]